MGQPVRLGLRGSGRDALVGGCDLFSEPEGTASGSLTPRVC